jgi:hypothetical protein
MTKILIHIRGGNLQEVFVFPDGRKEVAVLLDDADNQDITEYAPTIVTAKEYVLLAENSRLLYEKRAIERDLDELKKRS